MIFDRCPAFRASPLSGDYGLTRIRRFATVSFRQATLTRRQQVRSSPRPCPSANVPASQLSAHHKVDPSLAFLISALTGQRRRPHPDPTSTTSQWKQYSIPWASPPLNTILRKPPSPWPKRPSCPHPNQVFKAMMTRSRINRRQRSGNHGARNFLSPRPVFPRGMSISSSLPLDYF